MSFELIPEQNEGLEGESHEEFHQGHFISHTIISSQEDVPVINSGLPVGNESNESTAEERDTVPYDSTATTDTGLPISETARGSSYITYTSLQQQEVMISSRVGLHGYDNWSTMIGCNNEEIKRKRSISRTKGSRVAIRQRPVSLMLPRYTLLYRKVPPLGPS